MQDAIITLLAITFFALIAAILASKIKQPILLLFLFVGAIIGPHTLNFVRDETIISYIIEIGAVLLLFTIGLEFDLESLKKVGLKSIIISLLKIGIIFFFSYHVFSFWMSPAAAALLGIILSFSSTIIIIKILEARNLMVRKEIPTLIAILIVEDLIAVILLTLVSSFGKGEGASLFHVLEGLLNSLFVLVLVYIVLLAVLKPLFRKFILKGENDSVIVFTALSMIIFLSYIAHLLSFSFSLGAFLAGSLISSVVGSKRESKGFHHAISPFAFLFTSLFFIAVGALVDLSKIWEYKYLILAIIVVVIVTRLIAVGLLTYLFSSFRGEQTVFSSIIMISVGEFSLLIAREGARFNTGMDLVTITSVIIFLSAILMSFTLKYADAVKGGLSAKNAINTKIKIVASYIKEVFDGLDIETTYSINLKRHLNIIGGLVIAFFVFLNLFNRVYEILALDSRHVVLTILYYLVYAAILGSIAYFTYKQGKKAYHNLTVALANLSFTRDVRRTKRIIKASVLSFLFIIAGLFFPLAIFLGGISKWWGIVSVVLVAIGIAIIRQVLTHMDSSLKDHSYPQYEKFTAVHLKKYREKEEAKVAAKEEARRKPVKTIPVQKAIWEKEKKPFIRIEKK